MESSASSSFQSLDSSAFMISNLDRVNLFILRPFIAITFVLSFILLGWFLAWKLVLVHVPLVQEIFGLRNKPRKPKPPTGRFSRFYNKINARDPVSGWCAQFLKYLIHGLELLLGATAFCILGKEIFTFNSFYRTWHPMVLIYPPLQGGQLIILDHLLDIY